MQSKKEDPKNENPKKGCPKERAAVKNKDKNEDPRKQILVICKY